ncbi:MAG: DnaJ domain-containing protein [Gaiellaceae bacterium]
MERWMQTAARRDYYEVLDLPRDATAEAIKRAYRSRARELHPDVSQEPDAEAKFAELNEAYSVLSRSTSRLLYDHFGYRGRGHGWFDERTGPGDLLGLILSGGRRRTEAVAEVELDAAEARRGVVRSVEYWHGEPCPECGGQGAAPGAAVTVCPDCDGSGRRRVDDQFAGARLLQLGACPECGGRGQLVSELCPRCDGGGRIGTTRSARVRIPAGVVSGDEVPLGDGDAVVLVRVRAGMRDSTLVRGLALAGFLVAVAFLVYLLFAP